MMLNIDDLSNVLTHVNVIKNGRNKVTLKIPKEVSKDFAHVSLSDVKSMPKLVDGIKKVSINYLSASLTLDYDPDIFDPLLWDDLDNETTKEKLTTLIQKNAIS